MSLDPLVFCLVLAAAVMHASWNALVKAGGDRLAVQTAMMLTPSLVAWPALVFLPTMSWAAVPWLLLSTGLHLVYYWALLSAYRHGDLSQVYPIARGSAPGLVAVGAWLIAGEPSNLLEIAALALLSAGLIALAWRPKGGRKVGDGHAILFALLTGLTIAGYSLADGMGARSSEARFTYIAWLFATDGLPLLAFLWWRRRGATAAVLWQSRKAGLVGGLMSGAAYSIVIWAMSVAPLAHVVALRETSVLFAALIGTRLLREPFGRRRLAAAAVIVAGAAVLQAARG